MLLSTAWLLVKLVRSLLLVIDSKLDNLNKLKTVLLNGYMALED